MQWNWTQPPTFYLTMDDFLCVSTPSHVLFSFFTYLECLILTILKMLMVFIRVICPIAKIHPTFRKCITLSLGHFIHKIKIPWPTLHVFLKNKIRKCIFNIIIGSKQKHGGTLHHAAHWTNWLLVCLPHQKRLSQPQCYWHFGPHSSLLQGAVHCIMFCSIYIYPLAPLQL